MNSTKTYADFPPYVRKIKSTLSSWANADLHTCIDFYDYVFPDFPVEDLKSNLTTFLKSDLFESFLWRLEKDCRAHGGSLRQAIGRFS